MRIPLVHQRLEVCVCQEVAELVLDVAVVDVDPDGTQLEDGPGRLDPLDRVVGVDPHVVPRPDAPGGQVVGQPVGPGLHLRVGPALPLGDQVVPLGIGVDGCLEQIGEVELLGSVGIGLRLEHVLVPGECSGPGLWSAHGLPDCRFPRHRRVRREGVGTGGGPAPHGGVVARERGRQVDQGRHRAGPRRRMSGSNRNGFRRWSTTCTVVACEPGKVFEFAVTSGPLAVATWRYEFEEREAATGTGADGVLAKGAACRVTESWIDQRMPWFALVARAMGDHSAAHAEQEMATTLANLAAVAT